MSVQDLNSLFSSHCKKKVGNSQSVWPKTCQGDIGTWFSFNEPSLLQFVSSSAGEGRRSGWLRGWFEASDLAVIKQSWPRFGDVKWPKGLICSSECVLEQLVGGKVGLHVCLWIKCDKIRPPPSWFPPVFIPSAGKCPKTSRPLPPAPDIWLHRWWNASPCLPSPALVCWLVKVFCQSQREAFQRHTEACSSAGGWCCRDGAAVI